MAAYPYAARRLFFNSLLEPQAFPDRAGRAGAVKGVEVQPRRPGVEQLLAQLGRYV